MSITTKWGLLLFFMCQNLLSFSQDLNKYNHIGNEMYYHLSFLDIPSKNEKQTLEATGIKFVHYEGNQTYLISTSLNQKLDFGNSGIIIKKYLPEINSKLGFDLSKIDSPLIDGNKVSLSVSFFNDIDYEYKMNLVKSHGGIIRKILSENFYLIDVPLSQISELEKFVGIVGIDLALENLELFSTSSSIIHHANVLSNQHYGDNLNGDGVVIGIGDGGKLGEHIDFSKDWISISNEPTNQNHQNHIVGAISGQGNLNPFFPGYASKSKLIIEKVEGIIYNTNQYINNYQMSLTNNAYGIENVAFEEDYNSFSALVDQQILENDALLHVFAAGNFGHKQISNFPKGYRTVAKYTATSKNSLTVGAVDGNLKIASFSSIGPVYDGRIKPEITAMGVKTFSTGKKNQYYAESGTSMSSAAVTGVLSLLYQEYVEINNKLPNSGLMKSILCNTADDYGNVGPDFQYGFGVLNALRATKVVKNNQFYSGALSQFQEVENILDIPAGLEVAKVLLYWEDAPSLSQNKLINDLDIKIIDPNGNEIRPLVLNPNGDLTAIATSGIDQINNIEQIYIKKPVAGNYKIIVKGSKIPNEDWNFWVTYDFIKPEVIVTYPMGGESILSDHLVNITWDADITNQQPLSVKYSIDNGLSWQIIADNIAPNKRNFVWRSPKNISPSTLIRVSKKNQTVFGVSESFSMLYRPEELEFLGDCNNRSLKWNSYNPENKYQVYWYFEGEMKPFGMPVLENEITINIEDLDENKIYWFAVSAITPDGKESKRSNAISFKNDCGIVSNADDIENIEQLLSTTAYPNPVSENLVYEIVADFSKEVEVLIADVDGKVIFRSNEQLVKGKNEFYFPMFSKWPAGYYFVSVKDETGMITDKIYHY